MDIWRDKTEEQAERDKRVRALWKKFNEYQNRVRPPITYKDIQEAEGLHTTILSKILNGQEEFDRPKARTNIIKCIKVFIRRGAIEEPDEANELLKIAGWKPLSDLEVAELFGAVKRESKSQLDGNGRGQYTTDEQQETLILQNNHISIVAYTKQLQELLNRPSIDIDRIEILITTIFMLLTPLQQSAVKCLAIFPYSFGLDAAIAVNKAGFFTNKEDFKDIIEALISYKILRIKYRYTSMKYYHPAIQRVALKELKDGAWINAYEQTLRCYLDYYYGIFEAFIFKRYSLCLSAEELEKSEEYIILSEERENFVDAMKTMRKTRENFIKKRLIKIYGDGYEETLRLLDLPPDMLTDEEKDMLEDFKGNYQKAAAQFDRHYPLVSWFWKYLEYELNPKYFYTPNPIAELSGRLFIKEAYSSQKRDWLQSMIYSHWQQFHPKMLEEFQKENRLEEELETTAQQFSDLLYQLVIVEKMDYQAAWEIAIDQFLLPEEE